MKRLAVIFMNDEYIDLIGVFIKTVKNEQPGV
jgi:hypothetical protein